MTASTEQYPRRQSNETYGSHEPQDPTVHTDAHRANGPASAYDPATGRMHAVPAPGGPTPATAPVGTPATTPTAATPTGKESKVRRAGRVVSMKVAAIIGIVAFLLGAGLALLVGGLTGPGGTPPTGGPGGAPGTSQSSTTSGTSSTGT